MPYASTAPLAKRLQLKPGMRLLVLNAPDDFLGELAWLPEDAEVTETLAENEGQVSAVLLFAASQAELNEFAPRALRAIPRDGLLWVAHPKSKSKLQSDLTRDRGWDVLEQAGLRAIASIAIDATWSAVRFRPQEFIRAKADRRAANVDASNADAAEDGEQAALNDAAAVASSPEA